ncbi:MAG: hypothetical protein K6F23_02345 [Solobacterium sp.]|nr:hypothetical protein [Solobacterium sp.]
MKRAKKKRKRLPVPDKQNFEETVLLTVKNFEETELPAVFRSDSRIELLHSSAAGLLSAVHFLQF